MRSPQARRRLKSGLYAAALALAELACGPASGQQPQISIETGRALFLGHTPREGPQPLAFLRGSGSGVPAARFACANCHGRDGLGQGEGSLQAPAIRWRELARSSPQRAEAYDAASFVRAVAEGRDPGGRALDRLMPGYSLNEAQAASLIAYLQAVDEEQRIGVGPDTIRLGILSAGAEDGFPAALAQSFAYALPNPVFGRRVELVPLDVADGPMDERLRRADIFATIGLPSGRREFWPELNRLGIPNLFPRFLLNGDEPETELVGLLPTLDIIGRAAFDQAATCAKGPLTIAVGGRDAASKRMATAASQRAAALPGLPRPVVRSISDLIQDAARSGPDDACILLFAEPEEVFALLSASPPRRYVGLIDQFVLARERGAQGRNEFVLADPRSIDGRPIDMAAFAGAIAEAIGQGLRRSGRQITKARFMTALSLARRGAEPKVQPDKPEGGPTIVFRKIEMPGAATTP